jgi:hypothetical protein
MNSSKSLEKSTSRESIPEELEGIVSASSPKLASREKTTIKLFGQEIVRALALLFLLLIFIGIIFWSFMNAGTTHWNDTKELLQIILPAVTALLGSAFGFYFGTSK